ncbi:MAG: hypothetical protein IAF58_09675 [Leptolyngbya sp.]|nr:hypothetical protein [Candidatus Melainabacteria bacterium]
MKKKVSESPLANALIGVVGSKGGVGATTVCVNLATSLAQNLAPDGGFTTLVDANFHQPDAALQLSCQPKHTISEILARAHSLEPQVIEACKNAVGANSGLHLITPAIDGSAGTTYNLSDLVSCLPSLKASSSTTVVDLPRHLDRSLVSLFDQCDIILLVVEPNISSIAATTRWLAAFRDLEYASEKILLVANRMGSKARLLEQQLLSTFSRNSIAILPNAFRAMETAQIDGLPVLSLLPKDAYSKAMRELTDKAILNLVFLRQQRATLLQEEE